MHLLVCAQIGVKSVKNAFKSALDGLSDSWKTAIGGINSATNVIGDALMDAAGAIVDASKAAWAALAAAFASMEFAIPAFDLCCSQSMSVTSSGLSSVSPPPPSCLEARPQDEEGSL